MSPSSSGHQEGTEGPGLREIAQLLTTPARSGLVLTKDRLGRIAAEGGLPVCFGERSSMLATMFRAAADAGALTPLLDRLTAEAARWEARYAEWERDNPASSSIWAEWRGRLAATRALLAEMSEMAARVSPDSPDAGLIQPTPDEQSAAYED